MAVARHEFAGPWRGRRCGRAASPRRSPRAGSPTSWAMIPPGRVSEPGQLVGCADRVQRERSPSGWPRRASPRRRHRAPRPRARAGRHRSAIASAPALRSSLTRSSIPEPSIGPRTVIDDAGPRRRIDARVQADAPQVGAQLIDRDVAACRVLVESTPSSCSSVADSSAQLVVAVVKVRHEHRQVLRRQACERRAARLRAQLDDDEHAEQEGHGRDRELVPTSSHRYGEAPGDGSGRA